jgi:hypothetical protein
MNTPQDKERTMPQELIEKARSMQMTTEEREEQRINFAYGNLGIGNNAVTLEDVKQASRSLKEAANGCPGSQ